MHAQVPQFLDVEDKLIGPLTLRQFLFLLAGGGILFLLFKTLNFVLFVFIAIPVILFVLLWAFYKIGNQRFTKFVTSFLGFIGKPNIYTWKKLSPKKSEEEPLPKIIETAKPIKKIPEQKELEEAQWKIEI